MESSQHNGVREGPSDPEVHRNGEVESLQHNGVGSCDSKIYRNRELELSGWEEVEVDIGWGTMRGKARGSGPQLVLGVHGWLDNANTFDLLAHHMPDEFRFLSLDLPGHGRSDHFPPGFIYDPRSYMAAIKKTVSALGWKKFIYLGHSMGAVVGIMYTACFPEDVKAFISIDIIKPWSLTPGSQPAALKKYFLQYFDNESKASKPALVYQEEQLLQRTMEGSQSLDERGARILMARGTRPSGAGLVLTRDLRVKAYFIGFTSTDVWLEMARMITCPILIVKAKDGHHYESKDLYKVMVEGFRQDCQHFSYHETPGKHHVHLTDPLTVADVLTPFLDKHKESACDLRNHTA